MANLIIYISQVQEKDVNQRRNGTDEEHEL